jgi:hypothetical protein
MTMTKQLVMCAAMALAACGKAKEPPKEETKPVVEPAVKPAEPAAPKVVVSKTAPPVDAKVSAAFDKALACKWNDENAQFDDCAVLDTWGDVVHLEDEAKIAERAPYLVWRLQSGDLPARRVAVKVLDDEALDAHGPALLASLAAETDANTATAIAKLAGELKLAQLGDRAAVVAAFDKGSPDVKAALAPSLGDASCKECVTALANVLAAGQADLTSGYVIHAYPDAAVDAKVCTSLTTIALAEKSKLGVRAKAAGKLGAAPACATQLEPLLAGFEAGAKAGKDSDLTEAIDVHVLKAAPALRERGVAAARIYAEKAPNMTTRTAALDLIAHHDPKAKEFLAGFKSDMEDVAAHAKELAGQL